MITMLYRQRNQIQRDLIRATKTLASLIALRRKEGRPTPVVRPKYQDANTFTSRAEALAALGIETDPVPVLTSRVADELSPKSLKTSPIRKKSRNEGNAPVVNP